MGRADEVSKELKEAKIEAEKSKVKEETPISGPSPEIKGKVTMHKPLETQTKEEELVEIGGEEIDDDRIDQLINMAACND